MKSLILSLTSHELPDLVKQWWLSIGHSLQLAFITATVVGIIGFGYELFNFTESVDDEIYLSVAHPQGLVEYLNWMVSQGRWFGAIVAYFLGMAIVPFLFLLTGLLINALTVVYMLRIWNPSKVFSYGIGAALFASFPYLADVFAFNTAQIAYPLSYLLAILSLYWIIHKTQWIWQIVACLLSVLSYAIYQPAIGLQAATVVIFILFSIFRVASHPNQWRFDLWIPLVKIMVVILLAVIFYFISVEISYAITGVELATSEKYQPVPQFSIAQLAAVYDVVGKTLFNLDNLQLPVLGVIVFQLILLGNVWIILFSNQLPSLTFRFASLVLVATALLAPSILLWVIRDTTLSVRTLIGYGVIYAGFFIIAYEKSTLLFSNVVIILFLVTVYCFAYHDNKVFFHQYWVSQADRQLATQIATRIYQTPGFADLALPAPIALMGSHRYDQKRYAFTRYEVLGNSQFEVDDGDPYRMMAIFHLMGIHHFRVEHPPLLAHEYAKTMPIWPAPDSVAIRDGIIMVVFSKD